PRTPSGLSPTPPRCNAQLFLFFVVEVLHDLGVVHIARLSEHLSDRGYTVLRPVELSSELGVRRASTELVAEVDLRRLEELRVAHQGLLAALRELRLLDGGVEMGADHARNVAPQTRRRAAARGVLGDGDDRRDGRLL